MEKKRQLLDEYWFPGYRSGAQIQGILGDPKARVIRLERTQKKRRADVAAYGKAITTRRWGGYGICFAEMPGYIWRWKSGEFSAGDAGK